MELCQAIKDWNKLFVDAMSDMSKYFILMAKTMKISMQKWQWFNCNNNNNNNILWCLPINRLIILFSVQHNKHSKDRLFHTINNVHQLIIMSKYTNTNDVNERPPHTMNAPQQTMSLQKDATSESFFSLLKYFQ